MGPEAPYSPRYTRLFRYNRSAGSDHERWAYAMRELAENKILGITVIAVIGFGFLQGARLLDDGSGPYSRDEFALYGLLVDGLTFLVVALLSYFAKIEHPGKLFAVGATATVAYILLALAGSLLVPLVLVKQAFAGVGWATNILCWMFVFTCYKPRLALLMIALGYVVDVGMQPLLGDLPSGWFLFVPVYLTSVALLWLCLRESGKIAVLMKEPSAPKTTIQEAFSRTRRAIIATFAFSAVCGFVIESDALLTGVQYPQTTLTALVCLVVALVMVLLLALLKVQKVNMDYISPLAAISIATVLALRFFGIGDVQFSGSLMAATLISFYVSLWLMFISEAFERTLPAFFLLGLALAVARLSVAFGRLCALSVQSSLGLNETAVIVFVMWVLVIVVSGVFIAQRSYAIKLGRHVYEVAEGELEGECENAPGETLSRESAAQHSSPSEAALEKLMEAVGLSAREADVLRDYATGRTARYIADWYMISEHTVKTHLRRAYAKLDIHSRQELLDRVELAVAEEYREQAKRV